VQLQLPSGVKVYARVEWKRPASQIARATISGDAARERDTAPARRPGNGTSQPDGLDALDTGDTQIKSVIGKLRKVIGKDIPIMVLGETGTGKELLARAIHADSPRRAGPFVAVNCASIPEALIESELFGYEEGAFTGARKKGGIGKMVLANGGTLFLDEIGDMPLHLQARLLRALQERTVSPLGSNKLVQVDVAVVCATHRNMREMMASGQFREDLYYRLNGLVVRLPALRERDDLDAVAQRLLQQNHANALPLSEPVTRMLRSYHWPGNIRQLANLLRTAQLMAEGSPEITEDHLPDDFLEDWRARHAAEPNGNDTRPSRLADIESMAILTALKAHDGNISATAKALGVSRNTVYRRIEEAGGPSPQGD
ncbi:MAG: sigma 54-interacting transcriptional regulator, partial [Pseudomonadota bacterium]